MNFPPSYNPAAGNLGRGVPPLGNAGTLWSYLPDNGNKQAFRVHIVYYSFYPRWVDRLN